MNQDAIARFFRQRKSDLMRIAGATQGELEEGDVQNTAYEIAVEIQARRGKAFDFDSEADRTELIKWTYARLVKFADKHLRFAVSLDEDPKEDRPTRATIIARGVKAQESSDPTLLMERAELEQEVEEQLHSRYSELVAYVLLFRRFDTRKRLSAFLRIDRGTLRYRLHRAERRWGFASLFDGVARIDPDFHPTIAQQKNVHAVTDLAGEQREWAF